MSSCRMTSFVVRSAKRFHQVLAVDPVEVGEVVVVPDAHLVRSDLDGRLVHGVGRLLEEVRRLVDFRRERPDDQVAVPYAKVELDRRRELVALQFAQRVVEPARLQPGRIQVLPPLRARPAERVLEFDTLVPDCGERIERAGDVCHELFPHAPELRADGNLLPRGAGRNRQRRNEEGGCRCGAAEFQDVASRRMPVHGLGPFDCAHRTPGTPVRASGGRAQPAAARLTDQWGKYLILI